MSESNFSIFSSVMYYTDASTGSIKRAGMDGSNVTTLVTGLTTPWGITIDFKTSRLLWTDNYEHTIESSDWQGADRRTVLSLPTFTYPIGIAVGNDRIYWSEQGSGFLQSSTMDGNDIIRLYWDTKFITGLTLVPDLNRPENRTNPAQQTVAQRFVFSRQLPPAV